MRVVLLTGAELRHDFVRKALALQDGISLISSICEGTKDGLTAALDNKASETALQREHLAGRLRTERDFFGSFVAYCPDKSYPIWIEKGAVNDASLVHHIFEARPDLIVVYGSSILREPLVSRYKGRILNLHLGLSPYYRGSGTNFWALVNDEPELVGATFLHLDAGVDTGAVIHQIRARIFPSDGPHQIGCRLITDSVAVLGRVVAKFSQLHGVPQLAQPEVARYYRKRDFTAEAVRDLYEKFRTGLVDRYLSAQSERQRRYPLVTHPLLTEGVS